MPRWSESSVHRGNAFSAAEYPGGTATVVLVNPPYPHKKTDAPTEIFINRALDGLAQGRRLAAVIPQSRLVKGGGVKKWRSDLLAKNTLEAVVQMPDYLQPYASATTAIIYLRKGIPHPKDKKIFFTRVENDGFRLKKGVRIACEGDQLPKVIECFQGAQSEAGFSGWASLDTEVSFAPGAYIPARELTETEIDADIRQVVRERTAFTALHASDLVELNVENAASPKKVRRPAKLPAQGNATVGAYFDIVCGLKALHSKEGLLPGNSLIISSSGVDNGCYGFFDFDDVLEPPFVTVPSTGSIAIANVQEWPCGVTDDCLLLIPKDGVSHAMLYVAAAAIRTERWRFSYGHKATPARIAAFPLPHSDELIRRVDDYLERAARVEDQILADAEDALDSQFARERLDEIETGEAKIIADGALDARLSVILDD